MHRLDIHSVAGKGILTEEHVWLEVKDDIADLRFYLLCDTTYTDDEHISNELRHTFWFPQKAVSKGDWIKLMTKAGQNTTSSNDRKTTTHIFFWGLGSTVWNKNGDCAVLFKIESWKTKRA
jgi:hypothetical protein